jgi:hypothetical protein
LGDDQRRVFFTTDPFVPATDGKVTCPEYEVGRATASTQT